jgi:ankyrin repeat/BTB/POZ domain-containing protein 2
VAREAQRLSRPVGKCGKSEVSAALRIILTPSLAIPAVKACLRAAAMYAISGDVTRQTKSSRAGLSLHVGKMHRWMCLVKVGRFVHEQGAIYLTAAVESVLEELMARCLEVGGCNDTLGGLNNGNREVKVNAALLEQTVSVSSDFWGVFQPYSHLSSCRTSAGLSIPRCFEEYVGGGAVAAGGHGSAVPTGKGGGRNSHQALLTTCVGSIGEL